MKAADTQPSSRIWLAALAAFIVLLSWPGVIAAYEDGGNVRVGNGQTGGVGGSRIRLLGGRGNLAPTAVEQRTFLPLVGRERLPTSFTLIEQAQERGEIGEETALIYEVFATFGDARLPWRFQGDNSGVIDSDAVSKATQRFAQLSPATRETLVPFLVPPVYAGSWYDLRMNAQIGASQVMTGPVEFITERCQEVAENLLIPLETDHFVVWFPPNDNQYFQRALQISNNLEARIHPILTDLFRAPLSDAGLGCNPSDGRHDVYMVYDPIPDYDNVLAMVSLYPGQDCRAAATYMQVLEQGPSELAVMAHEFMHMIQRSYNPAVECFDRWWTESTANWAIDYFENIDPAADSQMEHGYADNYLETAHRNLVDVGEADDIREYGAYLWSFYLSHYTGSYRPQLIAEIYAATEVAGNGNLYKVIDDRIAGGWEQRWPEFAALNLNLAPKNRYEQWDQLTARWQSGTKFGSWANMTQDEDLYYVWYLANGYKTAPYFIGDLGIYYEEFAVGNDVRLVAVANPYVGKPFMRLQALVKRPGQDWEGPVDWSASQWTVLCQDDPAEKIERMILMFSNSNWQRLVESEGAPSALRVVTSDLPCSGWQGASSWELDGTSFDDQGETDYTIHGEATPRFTLSKRTLVGDILQLEYQPTAGNGAWLTAFTSVDYQTGNTASCEHTGGGPLSRTLGGLLISEDLSDDTMNRKFFASGLVVAPDRCSVFTTWTHIPWLTTDIRDTGMKPWPATATVGRLRGSDTLAESGDGTSSTTTSTWDLTPLNSQN